MELGDHPLCHGKSYKCITCMCDGRPMSKQLVKFDNKSGLRGLRWHTVRRAVEMEIIHFSFSDLVLLSFCKYIV